MHCMDGRSARNVYTCHQATLYHDLLRSTVLAFESETTSDAFIRGRR